MFSYVAFVLSLFVPKLSFWCIGWLCFLIVACLTYRHLHESGPEVIKLFSCLAEHEIYFAYKS